MVKLLIPVCIWAIIGWNVYVRLTEGLPLQWPHLSLLLALASMTTLLVFIKSKA